MFCPRRAYNMMFLVLVSGTLLSLTGCKTLPSAEPGYQETSVQARMVPQVGKKYQGARVAVVPFVNKTLSAYSYLGDASTGILPEYLLEAGFQPIEAAEGADLGAVSSEIEYASSGRVNDSSAASIGQHLGAQYVFVGGVNSYREVKGQGSRTFSTMGFGLSTGAGNIVYDLQVSGRLIDVETRAIVASKTVAHNEEFDVGGGGVATPWGTVGQSQEIKIKQENAGKVLHHAFNRLVAQMVNQINSRQ